MQLQQWPLTPGSAAVIAPGPIVGATRTENPLAVRCTYLEGGPGGQWMARAISVGETFDAVADAQIVQVADTDSLYVLTWPAQ